MDLWKVEVADVAHRYVEAESADDAALQVSASILAGLNIRATPAQATLARKFRESGPLKRRRLLTAMDGLMTPASKKGLQRERARLERLIRSQEAIVLWAEAQPTLPAPADPLMLEKFVKYAEIEHLERNLGRLSNWERKSPFHDG
ncbi:hypothetical protein GCM10027020_09470 [Nocardioides salsibiostraticola]